MIWGYPYCWKHPHIIYLHFLRHTQLYIANPKQVTTIGSVENYGKLLESQSTLSATLKIRFGRPIPFLRVLDLLTKVLAKQYRNKRFQRFFRMAMNSMVQRTKSFKQIQCFTKQYLERL